MGNLENNTKKTIAHCMSCSVETSGGLNALVKELANGLSQNYNNVILSASTKNEIYFNENKLKNIFFEVVGTQKEITEQLDNIVKKNHIDLLFFHGGDFGWGPDRGRFSIINSNKLVNIPKIFVNHQTTPNNFYLPNLPVIEKKYNSLKGYLRFGLAWILKIFQLVHTSNEITVSKYELKLAKSRYLLFNKKIDQVYHSTITKIPVVDFLQKKKIILFIGHFAFRKGQHILINAFARIAPNFPDWKLILIGAGELDLYINYIYKLIDDYNVHIQVEIINEVLDPEEYLREASIYVQPSLVEAYGLALQEAAYYGCACVGSRVGGISENIGQEEMLYTAGNDFELSIILEKIMRNTAFMHECQQMAYRKAIDSNINTESMVAEYKKLIQQNI